MTKNLNSYTTVYQIKKKNQVSSENTSGSVKTLWRQYDGLKICTGMLYRERIDAYRKNNRLKVPVDVPDNLKCEILHFYHD